MNTNHYLEIGADHKVCQDYAASGFLYNVERGPTYYAVVCDGCSSAPHSEFGAQVITHCAIDSLKHNPYTIPEEFIQDVMKKAKEAVRHTGVDPRCLFATLLLVRADTDNTYVWMWGDGVYNITLKNGGYFIKEVHYAGNAPYYPYYAATPAQHGSYVRAFAPSKEVRYDLNGCVGDETFNGTNAFEPTVAMIETEQIKSVTLMSDGVESYQDINKVSVPSDDIIREVTAFKTTTGHYVERRMLAFKQRLCVANQWSHYDDLSVAGISL